MGGRFKTPFTFCAIAYVTPFSPPVIMADHHGLVLCCSHRPLPLVDQLTVPGLQLPDKMLSCGFTLGCFVYKLISEPANSIDCRLISWNSLCMRIRKESRWRFQLVDSFANWTITFLGFPSQPNTGFQGVYRQEHLKKSTGEEKTPISDEIFEKKNAWRLLKL